MTDDVKDMEKKILITKNKKRRARSEKEILQLAKNREKTKKCRERQNISSISSRLVYKIPEPCLQINRFETPIILRFD